jgi:hypothetical protein
VAFLIEVVREVWTMVVEHSFITRLGPDETMRTALDYLREHGFSNAEAVGFRMAGDPWTSLKVHRGGKVTPRTAVADLPQVVHLEWDRGRVNVAASIEVPKKELRDHSQLLISITLALEELLATGMPPVEAGRDFRQVEIELARAREEQRRRHRRRTITALLFVVLACVAVIAIISIAH